MDPANATVCGTDGADDACTEAPQANGVAAADACAGGAPAKSYLLIFNVAKRQNWGTLLRSACAFGVSEVCVVGAKKLATFGSQGTAGQTPQRTYETLCAAKSDLASRGVRICGIEIDASARPIGDHPFTGPTAFMLGNEGEGMSAAQREACDFFVYIPQHSGATASLNVAIAGSIVLHHFALWAQIPEQARQGEKFVVDRRHALDRWQNPTECEREEVERKRNERASKRKLGDDGEATEVAPDATSEAVA